MPEKPYLYPAPRVLIEPGKTVPITSLPEQEQQLLERQILLVSEVAQLDFPEDGEWMIGS